MQGVPNMTSHDVVISIRYLAALIKSDDPLLWKYYSIVAILLHATFNIAG